MIESKLKVVLKQRNISIYRLSKMSGIDYELLRRTFKMKRKLSANEFIAILLSTGIKYEEVV